jgi:hypothetical protein
MLELYRNLGAGQVAVYDEAVLGLLSNDFQTPESRELVKAVNIVRAKGISVILCIPSIYRLVAGWRDEAVRFWVHCYSEPRGIGLVHERSASIRYERRSNLGLYKDPTWNPIRWEAIGGRPWAEYEKAKLERIDRFMEESKARLSQGDPIQRAKGREERIRKFQELRDAGHSQEEARAITRIQWHEAKAADRERGSKAVNSPVARRPRRRPPQQPPGVALELS